jgi:hypothetical protein
MLARTVAATTVNVVTSRAALFTHGRRQWRSGRSVRRSSSRRGPGARSAGTDPSKRFDPAAMTHVAIQEQLDGKAVEWLEKVSDERYQAKR